MRYLPTLTQLNTTWLTGSNSQYKIATGLEAPKGKPLIKRKLEREGGEKRKETPTASQPASRADIKHQNMPAFNLATCARPNILALEPYRCARDDYADDGHNVLLDANENAFGPPLSAADAAALQPQAEGEGEGEGQAAAPKVDLLGLHRYPDPHQHDLKRLLCNLRNSETTSDGGPEAAEESKPLTPENLFVGVGSDEAIDALLRAFCTPGRDTILVCPPTYGMYSVSAAVNDVGLVRVPLLPAPDFQVDVPAVLAALDGAAASHIKLVYLCSPGNPTGSRLRAEDVRRVLEHPTWNGLVVLDEAYVDFAGPGASLAPWAARWPNLVVLQTLSKAFGLAGIRLGAAFCAPDVARLLNSLKAPYNVSSPTSALASYALGRRGLAAVRANVDALAAQRARLVAELPRVPGVGRLRGGLESNFLLFEMLDAEGRPDNKTALAVYEGLAEAKHVVVRFRGKEHGCLGCLRITVGTEEECTRFLKALGEQLAQVRGTSAATPRDEEKREDEANGVVA